MTDPVVIALMGGMFSIAVAVLNMLSARRSKAIKANLQEVHAIVNSRYDRLLDNLAHAQTTIIDLEKTAAELKKQLYGLLEPPR